ncbi:hypothetical protein [Klebsiella variicola]|uniref:hypothetical protein n=1 Tax=Klebsiella variicola TaxID=244366 RepID=UPI00215A79D3|nr:hypothetical protein [Klebsiella variicola]
MKKIILSFVFIGSLLVAASSMAESQEDMVKKALSGDYQSQRDLAYSYANGWGKSSDKDFIPQDAIRACAWRKVLLLSNVHKAEMNDYVNESIDCKEIPPTKNQEVWKLVWTILNSMHK